MVEFYCPVKLTADVIGGKWKPLILFYLERGPLRFSELQKLIPGLTKKMLTQHLRELERDEIIHRKVYARVPPKVEYSLTRHGATLKPILKLMSAWGARHHARYGMPKSHIHAEKLAATEERISSPEETLAVLDRTLITRNGTAVSPDQGAR
jgi:DNA-binding HxlR family transcriptional regulator